MAFETGTATDCFDLFSKLVAFLTTDSELVAEGEEWTDVWQPEDNSNSDGTNGHDIVLRGPGLSASDQVYVGLRLTPDLLNDSAAISVVGMTGVIPSSLSFDDHVNVTPTKVRCFTRGSNPMDYWFTANGRRFVVVVQVSTVYESIYAGLFLPYGDPTQYSYPLFIGGCAGGSTGGGEPIDWRSTGDNHSNFTKPTRDSSASTWETSAWMLDPSGNWLRCGTTDGEDQNVGMTPFEFFDSANWNVDKSVSSTRYSYVDMISRVVPTYDDEFVLTPVGMVQSSPSVQAYGVLEGVYHAAGRGNSAENVIAIDGVDHIAFPNVFRTGIGEFWAVALGTPEDSNSLS